MTNPTIAELTELLDQQLQVNRTILNASAPHLCSPADAMQAVADIREKGGFVLYLLESSRVISEALDSIRSAENGAGTA